jgi:hypothetical protein
MLTCRHSVTLRGVGDDNPSLGSRLDVYVVHTYAGASYRLELVRLLDNLDSYLRGAPYD